MSHQMCPTSPHIKICVSKPYEASQSLEKSALCAVVVGRQIKEVNQQGRSQKAQLTCLELLLKHGAKTDIKGNQGKTALDLAKERKLADAIQILSREPRVTQ